MFDDPAYSTPTNAAEASAWMEALHAALEERDIFFRDQPEAPTTCCGRGCNGCVWEGYLFASAYWCHQARTLIAEFDARHAA